ncbi:MAG TPA: LysE family translocator [Burkholderiaceae bacterium]|nr:LysE family translocator [Burkholderiaceae bacterium]
MSSEELAALLTFATLMSFTPGPNTAMSTALGANHGLRRTLHFIVAVPTGWTLMMLACGLGLGALVLAVPALNVIVRTVGIGYLLWMAWALAGARTLAQADGSRLNVTFWQGVGMQFVNIKAWMLALALAGGWVTSAAGHPSSNPLQRLAIVCGVMALFALASNLAYALVGSLLRQWLANGSRLLWFNRAMALLLVATAVWMAFA